MGSPRCRSQGAESGRSDSSRSAAVFAKLGSSGRFAAEAGPGHVGIAGSRHARGGIARVGWARRTGRSSRAHMGVARGTLCSRATCRAGRRPSSTPSDVGIAACARGTGPGGSGAELGRACDGPVMGRAAGSALFARAPDARARCTSVGIAGRPIQGRHPDRAVLEPARSGGLRTGSARLHGLGRSPSRGRGATADRRTVVE